MDPTEALSRAIGELQSQNYGSAIRSLELLTARDPQLADGWKALARAYHATGRREDAVTAAQRYSDLRPNDATGHHNRGVMLAQLSRNQEAEQAFRAALGADPTHAKARRALHKLEETAAATPPPTAAPLPKADPKQRTPWPARIAAGLTVVASLAILAWLFLPGGPANPGKPKAAPEDTEAAISTPPPDSPMASDPNETQLPQPAPDPEWQPQPDADVPATAPTPDPQPQMPQPDSEQPSAPASAGSPSAQPLFSPQEAQEIAQGVNLAYQQDVAAAQGQIGAIAQVIRNLDEETWREGGRDALVLQATAMLGSDTSPGTLQSLQMISTAETPGIAASRLEEYGRTLPPALTPAQLVAIQQVLTRSDVTPEQAYYGIKGGFEQWGIGLMDGPDRWLRSKLKLPPPSGQGLMP